ncbi:hypothetical protein QRB41_26440 [Mycobacterium avium subsp. hominissuis]|uniref:hypothetical protein n=1 Tax=Mycobacterium avium TaxID=1764 RepID=UPI0026666E3B|nr:hypothetical protein [Mycobacterium avium]MDO2386869.1 hypothetical protein [Mycobacterium avium subsp. hominissuis]
MVYIESRTDMEDFMRTTGTTFVFVPQVVENEDGSWTARYPGAEWEVNGPDELSVRDQLGILQRKRMGSGADDDWQIAALNLHLTNGPIAGVYELDADTAARVHNPPNFDALQAALAEIDQQRAQ